MLFGVWRADGVFVIRHVESVHAERVLTGIDCHHVDLPAAVLGLETQDSVEVLSHEQVDIVVSGFIDQASHYFLVKAQVVCIHFVVLAADRTFHCLSDVERQAQLHLVVLSDLG